MPYKDSKKANACTRKWQQEHKEQNSNSKKRWRLNNIEKARKASRDYYYRNKKTVIKKYRKDNVVEILARKKQYARDNYEKWMEIIRSKNMHICSKCGYSECFAAIDFHHVNPENKEGKANAILIQNPTPEKIAKLDNYISLCANCHRELHFYNRQRERESNVV